MKKLIFWGLVTLVTLLSACTHSSPRDFYSMVSSGNSPNGNVWTIWLGMTKEEEFAATHGGINSDFEVRLRIRDGIVKSLTSSSSCYYPVGLAWNMTRDDIKAFYAKDPGVAITDAPNLLTVTKTIDGTLYYIRIVFYDDGTIKEINQTIDPTIDTLKFPGQS